MKIEKVHLGRGALPAANHTGSIDAVPVTDDWSKRRLLRFVKLQASDDAPLPREDVGTIKLYFFRASRSQPSGNSKTVATGFHKKHTVDPNKLVTHTTMDGLFVQSHATGLGPITFGPPKKVPPVGTQDSLPYVSFTFLYRSREVMSEVAPEDWTLTVHPPPANFDKELPVIKDKGTFGRLVKRPTGTSSSSLAKRPSIAQRAKKWAFEMKHSAKTIKPTRRGTDDKVLFNIYCPLKVD
ncbi:uncharacterized protein EI90DRAFT_3012713 [Cantharellus anzutake]|uniref:uncharacterized protein n=1 Tax=Cantharellus anzutake TaxID=1750568 RepID=UPI001907BE42|nr:uncharacterized protein EI90DRAFT_3012713 [Cantharellus anzutake]KAF8339772.1 hypothetical protein EI90DRAFT_3012713 [Cantharellus anzutake]